MLTYFHACTQVQDFLEKSTREERQGLAVEGIPDADLFYVDKAPEDSTAPKQAPIPRKLYHRQRLTRAQAIIQAAHTAAPVWNAPVKKNKAPPSKQAAASKVKKSAGALTTTQQKAPAKPTAAQQELDLWDASAADGPSSTALEVSKRRRIVAPAVAVDAPGCSYNPDREAHQETVAEAVAAEMKKVYDRDLLPTAPLRTVDYDPELDELEGLLVDADEDDDQIEAEAVDGSEGEEEPAGGAARKAAVKKTLKDRKRGLRARAADEELEQRRKEKKQRQQLSNLKGLQGEVEAELAEREERRRRRLADLAEKAATEPPKLGKHKFEALPLQVLTTEEIEATKGSLRQLKPTAVLAKDRFKSLQRRGLIEPRRKVQQKKGKKVVFVHGERADKAAERQAEVATMREKRRKAKQAGGK